MNLNSTKLVLFIYQKIKFLSSTLPLSFKDDGINIEWNCKFILHNKHYKY